MPRHLRDHLLQGRSVPGILVLNNKMGIGETIEELCLIWAASEEDEYRDRMIYLPLG